MTWLLVSTSPSALITMPVPAAAPLSYRGVVLMVAGPGLTLVTDLASHPHRPSGGEADADSRGIGPGYAVKRGLARRGEPGAGRP